MTRLEELRHAIDVELRRRLRSRVRLERELEALTVPAVPKGPTKPESIARHERRRRAAA